MASDLWDDFRGKPEKQSYSNYSEQSPWAPQQQYVQNLFGYGQGLYNRGPFSYAPSNTTATAEQLAMQRAQDPNSLVAKAQGQLGATISGQYLNPNTNPHLQGAVKDAMGLAGSHAMGLFGGPAGQNVGNSGLQEHITRTLANTALPFYANAYAQERQNQLNAMNMAPSMDYANINPLMAVGQQQDQRSLAAYNSPWDSLARYQAAITGNYGGVKTGSQELPWTSQIYDNAQSERDANFGLAGSAMKMFSDVRLKENIERIGAHDTGIGIYKYNYKGSDAPQIGVLAQELERVRPEAVGEVAGFKTVNYKMI